MFVNLSTSINMNITILAKRLTLLIYWKWLVIVYNFSCLMFILHTLHLALGSWICQTITNGWVNSTQSPTCRLIIVKVLIIYANNQIEFTWITFVWYIPLKYKVNKQVDRQVIADNHHKGMKFKNIIIVDANNLDMLDLTIKI